MQNNTVKVCHYNITHIGENLSVIMLNEQEAVVIQRLTHSLFSRCSESSI